MSRRQYIASLCLAVAALCMFGLPARADVGPGAQAQADDSKPVPVLIAFRNRPGPSEQALVRSHGGRIKYAYELVPALAASIPEQAMAALRANFQVVRVEPDAKVYAADGELTNAWGVDRIGAGQAHAAENRGAGVKVGIIDSGIDYTHPELSANYAGGWDFVNHDDDPWDDYGHGTHVAGIVGAADNGEINTGVVGVAPEASLYAFKVLSASGSGNYSDVIAALDMAVANGMAVVNLSLGSSEDPGQTVHDACDRAAAAGVVLVAAAGNSGTVDGSGDQIIYPARYSSVIAVGATTSSNERASYSSTGPDLELVAPGHNIYSTIPGAGYVHASGTSMACAHVAGTAALIRHNGISDARAILTSTADDLGAPGLDPLYGHGLVDAAEAGTAAGPANQPPVVVIAAPADGSVFAAGTRITFTGSASDPEDGDLTAALTWTSDLDGSIGTGGNVAVVLSPGSHTITASATDSGGLAATQSIRITVESPPPAPTLVRVVAITYATQGGKNNTKNLLVTVAIADDLGHMVAGGSVSVQVLRQGKPYYSGQGISGAEGTVTFKLAGAPRGYYSTMVTNVAAPGLIWDGSGAEPDAGFTKP